MFTTTSRLNLLKYGATALLFSVFTTQAAPIPIDLSTWQSDGTTTWQLQPGNDTVRQTQNTDPTIFFKDGENAQGTQISGRISSNYGGDDDFIGFVLGYQDNELTSASAEYILIDWKQGDQSFPGLGQAFDGLAASVVTGAAADSEFWTHTGAVSEVTRATTLGSTGWVTGTEYLFDIVFTSNLIQVYVDNVLELNFTAADAGLTSFGDGSVGFYNYSQQNVLYAGLTEQQVIPTVSTPAALGLFVMGIAGLAFRRKTA